MKSLFVLLSLMVLIHLPLKAQPFKPKFFCFEDAFLKEHTLDPMFQASLLKELGFDGMELMGLDRIDEKLKAIETNSLQLFMVYIRIDLEKNQPYDPRLKEFIKKVAGKGVTLWLHVISEKLKPSDPEGDKILVPMVQELADFAAIYEVKIALYPHSFFWLEKVDDSVRLTKKINRRNVGAVFNLCHYLRTDERSNLKEKLTAAIPYLAAVSINGADDGTTNQMDWDKLIQPLGKGSFNVPAVLKILKDNHYSGPVGLQCYSIPGKPEEYLRISSNTWKSYLKKLK